MQGQQVKQQLGRLVIKTCTPHRKTLLPGAAEWGGSSPEGTGSPPWLWTPCPHCDRKWRALSALFWKKWEQNFSFFSPFYESSAIPVWTLHHTVPVACCFLLRIEADVECLAAAGDTELRGPEEPRVWGHPERWGVPFVWLYTQTHTFSNT